MKHTKRIGVALLAFCLLFSLFSCGEDEIGPGTKLSFKAALSYDYLSSLSGQTVTINGYMATSSPVDGSYLYLMNLPYQNCPFCKPNTSELSNTIAVYPKEKKKFDYTTQAIAVTGILLVAPEKTFFSDRYGYTFSFKIVDAQYKILSSDELGAEASFWQKFSEAGLAEEINRMYEYVNFVCLWNTYFCNSVTNVDGSVTPGFYLYPADALNFLQKEDGAYHYGTVDGYFEGIIEKIEKIDSEQTQALVQNVRDAKVLAEKGLGELTGKHYTFQYQYVEKFQTYDNVYTLDKGEELEREVNALFDDYSLWLSSFEM